MYIVCKWRWSSFSGDKHDAVRKVEEEDGSADPSKVGGETIEGQVGGQHPGQLVGGQPHGQKVGGQPPRQQVGGQPPGQRHQLLISSVFTITPTICIKPIKKSV